MKINLELTERIACKYPHIPNKAVLVVKRTLEIPEVKDEQVLIVEGLTADNFPIKIHKA
ncbi:hypothetical protein ACX93W_26565 [Paenibacillus sp. CAU 1782]